MGAVGGADDVRATKWGAVGGTEECDKTACTAGSVRWPLASQKAYFPCRPSTATVIPGWNCGMDVVLSAQEMGGHWNNCPSVQRQCVSPRPAGAHPEATTRVRGRAGASGGVDSKSQTGGELGEKVSAAVGAAALPRLLTQLPPGGRRPAGGRSTQLPALLLLHTQSLISFGSPSPTLVAQTTGQRGPGRPSALHSAGECMHTALNTAAHPTSHTVARA